MASAAVVDRHEATNDAIEAPIGQKRHRLLESFKTSLFVLGTAVIVVVACRNSLTWLLSSIWGLSGDFWQSLWEKMFDELFDGDEWTIGFWGTAYVTMITFYVVNGLLMIIDFGGFFAQYKIQSNEQVDGTRFMWALVRVLFNQVVIGGPTVIWFYQLAQRRGCSFGRELPTFHWVVWELFVFVWVEEVMFYYSHRLFHHPRLYKHIHKIHHEWTAPVGIIGMYAHPLEHLVANLIPPMLGPLLCGSHITTAWLWYTLALMSSANAHSGYHFPFFPSPEAHDFHHLKFNQCFGVMGVLDRFHGTDTQFRATKCYQRHVMMLSTTPAKEVVPDDEKKQDNECQASCSR